MVNKELLTVSEIAEALRVTRNTIYVYIRQGLPFYEVGPSKRKRFDRQEVEGWFIDRPSK